MIEHSGPTSQKKRCWNTIGVWGSEAPRCAQLEHLAHCRNCPVFIQAGRELFDRKPPEGYLEAWTRTLTVEKKFKSKEAVSVLVFRLGPEWFAMGTLVFKEVSEVQPIHRIPHAKDPALLGVINIRGELQLCISLHLLLEIEKKDDAAPMGGRLLTPRMIVMQKDHSAWVFPADEVSGLFRYDPKRLQSPPATVSKAASAYTQGVFMLTDKKIGHLDDSLLFGAINRRFS